jgi:uncharacterized membrane protein HdeD (DUF308 family)
MNDKQKEQALMQRLYVVDSDNWWLLLVAGIISLVLGIIIVVWPQASTAVLVIIFGIFILLLGIVAFIRSFMLIKKTKSWWVLLIEGIIGIAAAIVLFVWPGITTAIIAYILGAWLLIIGIIAIVYGSVNKSVFPILSGILSVIIGLLVLFSSPLYALATLIFVFGILSIIRGVILIIQSIILKKSGPIVAAE